MSTRRRKATTQWDFVELERLGDNRAHFAQWQQQIETFKAHADALPDQRRHVIKKEFDDSGQLLSMKGQVTVRGRLGQEIKAAEDAARRGDLGAYGLAVIEIMNLFFIANLENLQRAAVSRHQRAAASKPRRSRWGTLRTVLDAMECTDADHAVYTWREGGVFAGFALTYNDRHQRPFRAGSEGFTEAQVRQKVSAMKR